ncbi:MAG: tetratricopeptide repeat protein [Vicinamibacterales bacterium]
MRQLLAGLAVSLFLAAPVLAQQHESHAGPSPDQLGTVHFETSCSPAVRGELNRAVALLHSFEYRPAMETLTKVLERDPSCAVAYWGIALCHWGNPFAGLKTGPPLERGRAAAEKGLATGTPTPRERAYVAAAAELFTNADTVPHRERTLAYARAMEALQRDFPQDVEARIFYALAVNQTAAPTDKTYAAQLKAAAILEPLWKEHPDHPGLPHYIIHAYDHPPLAAKALDAARRYAKIAPSAPHALHMPSHTFTRVGYWTESAETNIASEKTAIKLNVMGEALHAMDYQMYAYLQMARDKSALAVLQRTPGVTSKLDVNAMGGAAPGVAGVYASAAIAARYALERGAWADAAALQPAASAFPFADAITHFARALGAARSGQPAAAQADIDRLAALRDTLAAAKEEYWREQVDIQRRVAEAWVAFASGRKTEGIALMQAAAESEDATDKSAISPGPLAPARELLGEMLLEAGNAKDALVAFDLTMKKEPSRFRGAYGAARAAETAGDRARARQLYRTLLDIARSAEGDRPELRRAREFVATSDEVGLDFSRAR